MRFISYVLICFFCCNYIAFSQQIIIDDSVGLQPLIENNLVEGCVGISNINSSVNGNSSGFPSFGYFERGNSNFPFESGILLSTGRANSGGNNLNNNTLSEGNETWVTDPDLEAALGVSNTLNATSIEFDFVSISNQFQFNYLLASEEYFGTFPCQFSDGFVFLIREAGTSNPYQNIALIPGSTTPVNTNTIRSEIFGCPAQNAEFFAGSQIGDTNFNGRTSVLTASGSVTPNVTYHVKLIIADQTNGEFDSAVFIEGNSFKVLDLGEDISTCADKTTLDADIKNTLASYAWYRNEILLPSETEPTLTVEQSGLYKVEISIPINGTNCIEEDEVNVLLSSEEPINPISDFEFCDSVNGNGVYDFDLSEKDSEIIDNIPFSNYESFNYFTSESNARSNTDPVTNTVISTSLQEIFVRIDDLDSDCVSYTSFFLRVNPIPNITDPDILRVCDSDESLDGLAVMDLTENDMAITAGNSNLMVSYHNSPENAETGIEPLPSPYINDNPGSDTVYVRVIDVNSGCVNTTILNIEVTLSPEVNRNPQFLDACDSDLDGNANFDLTEVIDDILTDQSGVSVSFHTSSSDAEMDINRITNETNYNYENNVLEPGSAIIYLRVQDDMTQCVSVVPFEIHTNLLLTGTDTGDFALCDNNEDPSDSMAFDLSHIEAFIINELPYPITVDFFETEEERNNGVNALDKSLRYTALSPKVLYITVNNGSCSENASVTLLVNPILQFENVTVPYCDTDDDGFVDIDLHSLDSTITGDNDGFTVSYFKNQIDAEDNNTDNLLPDFYRNSAPIESLYARIEHRTSGCSTVNPFQIEVVVAPSSSPPTDIIICDNDQDGFSIINIEQKIDEAVNSRSGLDINAFTSLEDANANINSIPVDEWSSYNTNTQTIVLRIEDALGNTNCFALESFNVIVNTIPIIPTIENFQICDNNSLGIADFLLSEKDAEILNGAEGREVYYFENESDALSGSLASAIDKNSIYQNNGSPQTLYVRVENITDATCSATSSFVLQVSPDPVFNPFTDYLICDDLSNDEKHEFNLEEKANEIRSGTPNPLNISFHATPDEANNNLNALPNLYTNETNPESIYVRIESDDSLCFVVEQLGINIIASPQITEVSQPLTVCDSDYDGIASFNLEQADFQILDRVQSNLIINYFENQEDINFNDGLDNSNEILGPTEFISNSKTVYIKVANTFTECFSVIPLELVVELPPAINDVTSYPICNNETNTFDLSLINDIIVDSPSSVDISYFSELTQAENNQSPLDNAYTYISNNDIIFIRISNQITGCYTITSFELLVNKNPVASAPPALIDCDDDFDGFLNIDLNRQNNAILNTLDPILFEVTHYTSFENAENELTPISDLYSSENGDIIFSRLENRSTGCFDITQFEVIINPLPVVPIEDIIPLCLEDLPLRIDAFTGDSTDTYLWSTTVNNSANNSINSSIEVMPNQLGTYAVTVTTANNCTYTKTFSVIESEQAEINFTSTVDFQDPNSITVDINTARIGNYVFILDDGLPQESNIFNNVTFGPHTITVRDLNGCMDESKPVFVFDIPKFFTPNDDGFSDTWHIIGANQLPGSIVYIYNRYGKLIKTLPHDIMGWDGTFNGANMPSDDYWYVANIIQDGSSFEIKGHFALKR